VKEELEQIVLQMYRSGLQYSGAVREFQKTFLATVLREANGNQVRAARKLGIHRNTLRRQSHELELDIKTLRSGRRRPALSERVVLKRKMPRAVGTPSSHWSSCFLVNHPSFGFSAKVASIGHDYGTRFDGRRLLCNAAGFSHHSRSSVGGARAKPSGKNLSELGTYRLTHYNSRPGEFNG
jgi:Fis family transcriptional regulator, factor for inversion stimulation protein